MKWIINLNEFHEMKIRDDCWSSANRNNEINVEANIIFHTLFYMQVNKVRRENKTQKKKPEPTVLLFFFRSNWKPQIAWHIHIQIDFIIK